MARETRQIKPSFVLGGGIKSFSTVLRVEDAEQPILSEDIRLAVHQWITEIRSEDELKDVRVQPRRTVLLEGPPGCGKTTLAHHLAARLGLPLVCIHLDRLKSKWVGQTGGNIADLFDELSDKPGTCMLFLDEFDAVAAKRSDDGQASSREHNAVVNSLLGRIESFQGNMIAATNRSSEIDPAIWRRFGMQLQIPLPGPDERFAILKRYLEPLTLPEESLDILTEWTEKAAPALLRQLMEGIKRDIVLAPKMNHKTDIHRVFGRVIASVKPHPDYDNPPLWEKNGLSILDDIKWPPERGGQ